ncbi:hypothetical protein ACO0LG_17320 [Undibacterium sp. Ji42W]|uniref:hypothetical protein n=1 Tax=Undibacterium sp. Ji42W TaxID=3413039 RepID=UPI003BEF804B
MTHIIAGRLQQQDQVQQAIHQLMVLGFAPGQISSFYLNPPGQHDMYPLGGDRDESPGATKAGNGAVSGAAAGGAVGAAVGLIGAPVTGPVSTALGALVGAHVGALIGSLSQMKDKGETTDDDAENAATVRRSGMMVAVSVNEPETEQRVIRLLTDLGADQIELGEGTISKGDWTDFDPRVPPNLIPGGLPSTNSVAAAVAGSASTPTVEQQAADQGVAGREL